MTETLQSPAPATGTGRYRSSGTAYVWHLTDLARSWTERMRFSSFVAQCDHIDFDATFEHGDGGQGSVADAIRWLGHEFVHHQLDVNARAGEGRACRGCSVVDGYWSIILVSAVSAKQP